MEPFIDKMFKERSQVAMQLIKLDTAIKAMQDVCDHDLVVYASDSHNNHYQCTKCGHKERY
ncbi:MAG: hypothetical protein Q8O72_10490 [Bacteroidales bacterium]|nr:hypothetical protein [Bacteroidales bacterium]